jgi:hypothetical protein
VPGVKHICNILINNLGHESKGLAISKDRLDVLQKQGYHADLQIIDKEDDNGNAAGTKIIIELSTELIY